MGMGLQSLPRVAPAPIAPLVGLGLLSAKVLPAVDAIWPSRQIAQAFMANRPCPDSHLISAGYEEPSLVFLTATSTLLTNSADAAQQLQADACAVAAIERSNQPAFEAAFAQSKVKPQPVAEVSGVNYSNGRSISVALYRMPPAE